MRHLRTLTFLPLAAVLAASGCVSPVKTSPRESAQTLSDRRDLAEATVEQWYAPSASAARRMMDEYGVPDQVQPDALTWSGNGPWKRTVVRNLPTTYGPPEDQGAIEQTVDYGGSALLASLPLFDDHVRFDGSARELTARSDSEEMNFLRLNVADDIARGSSPADARSFAARVLSFEAAGKTSPYLQRLRFTPSLSPVGYVPSRDRTGDRPSGGFRRP